MKGNVSCRDVNRLDMEEPIFETRTSVNSTRHALPQTDKHSVGATKTTGSLNWYARLLRHKYPRSLAVFFFLFAFAFEPNSFRMHSRRALLLNLHESARYTTSSIHFAEVGHVFVDVCDCLCLAADMSHILSLPLASSIFHKLSRGRVRTFNAYNCGYE